MCVMKPIALKSTLGGFFAIFYGPKDARKILYLQALCNSIAQKPTKNFTFFLTI